MIYCKGQPWDRKPQDGRTLWKRISRNCNFSKMIPTQEKGNMHGRIMVRSVGGPDFVKCTHKMFGKK